MSKADRSETLLQRLQALAQEQGWQSRPGKPIPYGEQIILTDGTHQVVATYYPKNDKMLIGGRASPLKTHLLQWKEQQEASAPASTPARPPSEQSTTTPASAADTHYTATHIGMDESGKGDWFGPLVVAAVYANEETLAALKAAGVRDSKTLEVADLPRVTARITGLVPPEQRHVLVLPPADYNRRYVEHQNINILLAELHAETARAVVQSSGVAVNTPIVCDQFAHSQRLEHAFAEQQLPAPVQQYHAEDASIAVAAASILATTIFTGELVNLGLQAGLPMLPKGSTNVRLLRRAAEHILRTQGPDALGNYAKLHFRPVQQVLAGYRGQGSGVRE